MTDGSTTRRTCVLIDLELYSTLDGQQQHAAQHALDEALTHAATEAGLSRLTWHRQESGDGELAVLPAEEHQSRIVVAFSTGLDSALQEIRRRDGLFLRVRVAMVYGVVTPAPLGHSGHAVIDVARIADALPVRRALAGIRDCHVVLALSPELFRDVIRNGHGNAELTPAHFRCVPIDRIAGHAWITIPGVDRDRIPIDTENEPGPPDRVAQTAIGEESTVVQARDVTAAAVGRCSTGYHTTFAGPVRTDDLHIGPRNG